MRKLKKRKAPGPDKLHNEMLVKMENTGKKAVLRLINQSWSTGMIPKNWKNAILSPILKKGKPAEDLNSYRPISITSCLGKLSERMIYEVCKLGLALFAIMNDISHPLNSTSS